PSGSAVNIDNDEGRSINGHADRPVAPGAGDATGGGAHPPLASRIRGERPEVSRDREDPGAVPEARRDDPRLAAAERAGHHRPRAGACKGGRGGGVSLTIR